MLKDKTKLLSAKELSVYFESLALLLQAGLPVNECPCIIAENFKSGYIAKTAEFIFEMFASNEVFVLSDAMQKSGAFDEYSIEMIKLGETSGCLEKTSASLAKFYIKQDELNQSIKQLFSGPLLLLSIAGIVVFFIILFALPVFEQVFASLGFISSSTILHAFFAAKIAMLIIILMLVALISVAILYAAQNGKKKLYAFAQFAPVTKKLHYRINAARFAYALEMLISAGVAHTAAIENAAKLINNSTMAKKIPKCISDVNSGQDLATVLIENNIFDTFEAKVLISASKAGQSETALAKLSQIYSLQATNGIELLLNIAEPAFVGILSISIGIILISVMLPLANIISAIG